MLVECELPVNEEDVLALVTEFAADRELVHNLRFWMANLGVTLIVLDNQKSQGDKLIELIDASPADAR